MTTSAPPLLEVRNLTCELGGRLVLDDVSFTVQRGEIFGVMGMSGAGKSTLLRNIMGLVRPQSGAILVEGTDVVGLPEQELNEVREAWIQGSGYGPIFGERVNADGTIDADFVVTAMANVQIDNPMEGLLQAFHELSAFALFAATTSLPREQELALSRDVTARLKRIRL